LFGHQASIIPPHTQTKDNIAVSFLPDFESLSKKALEKDLNYFIQGYIHNIKISETHACGSKIMQDVGGQ
jgi:hypothetical protein